MAHSPASALLRGFINHRVGWLGSAVLLLAIAMAPAILFFDPTAFWPSERHVAREPQEVYVLFSDDVAYIGDSRTWDRTVEHLFQPHNAHVVPIWRIVTWAQVVAAGSLERLPEVLAFTSFSILIAVMILAGRLVARETGRWALGFASMILIGTTSLMFTPAIWYSAGQTLWAAFGILTTLWYVQIYRQRGRIMALPLAALFAATAGWFWTVGHVAGPVAAVYLFTDGRRRCRIAALVPLAASLISVAITLAMAAARMDTAVSFHGRTAQEAMQPVGGVFHTLQAIPESLILGNLGLAVETTPAQGAVLTLGLLLLWFSKWPLSGRDPGAASATYTTPDGGPVINTAPDGGPVKRVGSFNPLECAGFALVFSSYLLEWTFRGYLEYRFLRTINMRFIVPWYHVIPHVGMVLWIMGWWARVSEKDERGDSPMPACRALTIGKSIVLCVMVVALLLLHRPRVDFLALETGPPLLPTEAANYPVHNLHMMRSNIVALNRAAWQRATLRRLDRAQEVANRYGLGKDTLRAAFGHPIVPETVGVLPRGQADLYDSIALLAIPDHGPAAIPPAAREELSLLFAEVKEPRPVWIQKNEPWPPPTTEKQEPK